MTIYEDKKYNFLKITPDEGYVLTSWTEGEDIKKYSSSTLMYTPITYSAEGLKEITLEEDSRLKTLQREAYEKEEAARRR